MLPCVDVSLHTRTCILLRTLSLCLITPRTFLSYNSFKVFSCILCHSFIRSSKFAQAIKRDLTAIEVGAGNARAPRYICILPRNWLSFFEFTV